MTDWKELIGKRVLLGNRIWGYLEEAGVLEITPSGGYVKMKWEGFKRDGWYRTKDLDNDYIVLEVLD